MKEKVNTHFSFPDSLDMSRYMEQNLIGKEKMKGELFLDQFPSKEQVEI